MAGQTQQNATAVKLGTSAVAAAQAAAKSQTKIEDSSRLPAGIENGVGRVVSMKIQAIGAGKQNAGKPMFVAQAVVVKPEYHDGVKVAGRRTSMMEMLFDTPGKKRATVKDHYDHVFAYLRDWGVNTAAMFSGVKTDDELNNKLAAAFEMLVRKKKITISFRTWKGQVQTTGPYAGKEPLVNETWGGLATVAADAAPPEATVQDDSGPADETPSDDGDQGMPADETGDDGDTGDDSSETKIGELTDAELDELVATADGDPGQEADDAGVRIAEWLVSKGIPEEDHPKAPDWATMVAWGKGEWQPEEEAPAIEKGSKMKYKTPSGPGKPSRVAACVVDKLYKVKGVEVADLTEVGGKKAKFAAVPVEKLEAA